MPGNVGHHAVLAVGLLDAGALEETRGHAGQLLGSEIDRAAGLVDVDAKLGLEAGEFLAKLLDLGALGRGQGQAGALEGALVPQQQDHQ